MGSLVKKIDELARLIDAHSERERWCATAIKGLYLTHLSSTHFPRTDVNKPVFCGVAQGAKNVVLNGKTYRYDPSKYMVVSMNLPVVGEVAEASRARPFLGFSMELDVAEIARLSVEAAVPLRADARGERSLYVSPMDEDLLDAVIRLLRLLKKPEQIPVLEPLIRREIYYKLLLSAHGGLLRRLAAENSQASRIAGGIEWLRKNALRTIRMEELASRVNMSPSTMHTWFKAVTTMSPLQYQKQLRLRMARQMLLTEESDAATVSQKVGYESASQFSREYRRLFGEPPARDIERLRAAMAGN